MFRKTKNQIEDLSRRVKALEKDNCNLVSHIHQLEWDVSILRKYREHDRRVLYCHDCQRYPATDELSTAFCKVCEDASFRLKLKVESDVPKKTCLDDMVEKYFIAFDYHCKDIARRIYERTEGSNP